MKAIRIFLSAIIMMMAITVQAQSVWIYKSDGTKVAYDASLVESVEYVELCSIKDVVLLEDYNIDEGKHTFAESLIVSSGTTTPSGATVQYGVVCTADKTIVPTTWGDASNAIATSDGIWQVWAKITPSDSNKGYKEWAVCVGEVRISETDYGYYSFNAASTSEIKNLTADDFTGKRGVGGKLTATTSEVDCGVTAVPVVAVPTEKAPIIQEHSKGVNSYISPETLKRAGTLTISINNVTYYIYYSTLGRTGEDTDKIKIKI